MSRSPSRTLKLTYLGDASQLSNTTKGAGDNVATLGQRVGKVGKALAVGFAAIGAAGLAMGRSLFNAFEEVSTANSRIESVVDSMGNFEGQIDGVTGRLVEQAEATAKLTGVDRTLVKETQALLLTFDSVNKTAGETGGIMDRATDAAVDLAAAGFGSATSNAQSLGRALEDPIRGLTSLTRQGVTFTEEQQNLIKSLVDSNKTLEAQELILEAIEKQVGGVAEATADGSARMSQSFGVLRDRIATALAPAFESLVDLGLDFITNVAEWWDDNGDRVIEKFRDYGRRVKDAASEVAEFAKTLATEFKKGVEDSEFDLDSLRTSFERLRDNLREIFGPDGDGQRDLGFFRSFVSRWATRINTFLQAQLDILNFLAETYIAFPTIVANAFNDAVAPLNNLINKFNELIDAANTTISVINVLSGTRINLPSIPRIPTVPEVDVPAPPPGRDSRGRARDPVTPSGIERNIIINIEGAVDPVGTARQVQGLVTDETLRSGASGTDLASIRQLLR